MEKPIILAVDDDQIVLNAIDRDLQIRYGKEFRIVAINMASAALDFLKQTQQHNKNIALFLVDQRMPQMNGVEFLLNGRNYFPAARKALLTAYADTEAAIDAINLVRLDYYLVKPWDPPEELLYPILDDLLADWRAWMYPPGKRSIS